jgi:hypothetical protein
MSPLLMLLHSCDSLNIVFLEGKIPCCQISNVKEIIINRFRKLFPQINSSRRALMYSPRKAHAHTFFIPLISARFAKKCPIS